MWRYIRGSCFVWFGLLSAVVGTPFLVIAVYQLGVERDIANNGVDAVATLVEKGHSTSRGSSSNYWLKYVLTMNTAQSTFARQRSNGKTGAAFATVTRSPFAM